MKTVVVDSYCSGDKCSGVAIGVVVIRGVVVIALVIVVVRGKVEVRGVMIGVAVIRRLGIVMMIRYSGGIICHSSPENRVSSFDLSPQSMNSVPVI